MLRNLRNRVWLGLVLPFVWAGPAGAAGPPSQCGGGVPQADSAPAMIVCDSGGEGATSCETKTTISISGFGTTSGCGISCATGFYACCQSAGRGHDARCTCLVEEPHGPYTPEGPSKLGDPIVAGGE